MSIQGGSRRSLFSTCSLGLAAAWALAVSPAAAQEASQPPEGESGVGEIVVTAQFRAQNLQDVPLAVTAVDGEELEERSLTNIAELGASVPNTNMTVGGTAFGNITQTFIRGIGQGDFNYAFEPGVGMYIDDVYYGTMFGTVFDLLDLERVEVLRGPQGTLFGKNSIGGAVRLISRQPTGDGSGFFEVTYGDFERLDVRGSADLTVVPDRVFLRISGVSKQRDGYQDVIDFACENPAEAGSLPPLATGPGCKIGTFGGEDVRAGRASLRAVLSEDFEISITGDVLQDRSPLQANSLLAVDTAAPTIAQWNNRVNIPTYGIPWDERFISDDPYKTYATYTTFDGIQAPRTREVNAWGVSGAIEWGLADNVAFKSISAYRTYDGNISHDPDQSPLSIQVANSIVGNEQFTQEFRLAGRSFDERLDWTVGAFYYDAESTLHGPVILDAFGADAAPWGTAGPIGPDQSDGLCFTPGDFDPVTPGTQPEPGDNGNFCPPVPPLRFTQNDVITSTSASIYLHAILALTDRLNVFGGYRYTDEEKAYSFDHSGGIPGVIASGFFSIATPAEVAYTRHDWRVGADFNATDDILLYIQASTGYRGGGINPRPFSPTQLTTFGPEEATAYEGGVKSDWMDGRLRANLAVFFTDYQDRIVNQQINDTAGLPFTGPINLGTATVQGAELEVEAVPVDGLTLSLSYGYLDIELDPQAGAPDGFIDGCTGPPFCTAPIAGTIPVGSITPGVPEETLFASIQYELPLGDDAGTITPRLDYLWRSEVFADNANSEIAKNDAYGILNGRLTWEPPGDDWTLALSVTNLTDEQYFYNKFTLLPFGLGTLEGQPARPREWAVTVRRRF